MLHPDVGAAEAIGKVLGREWKDVGDHRSHSPRQVDKLGALQLGLAGLRLKQQVVAQHLERDADLREVSLQGGAFQLQQADERTYAALELVAQVDPTSDT